MKTTAAALIVLAILASGCFQEKNGDPPGTATSSQTSTLTSSMSHSQTNTTSTIAVPLEPPRLILNSCTGWNALRYFPGPTAPGPRPPEWPAAESTREITGISIHAYECQRVSMGPYERGPLHVVTEHHTNVQVPESCQKDLPAITDLGVLTNFLIDDSEIGDYLRTELGMPISVGVVSDTETTTDAGTVHTWSWQLPNGAPSEVMIVDMHDSSAQSVIPQRLFWANGQSVERMDVDLTRAAPQVPTAAGGTVNPPFYMASDSQGHYAGVATWNASREATGTFISYQDLFCEVPK